jgi:predicted HTH domain antitoxin
LTIPIAFDYNRIILEGGSGLSENGLKTVTKSVRFSAEESALIERVSQREHLPEGTFVRKLVLDGLSRYRLDDAVEQYEAGASNLGQAAHAAGVTVRRMLAELDRRGIHHGSAEDVMASLENLAELFGGSPEFLDVIAEARTRLAQANDPTPETAR